MEELTHAYDLYRDIQKRTGGEIYIGVVGPVRTGKSTFIKRFMEEMVLPNMEESPEKIRALDEMPQSAAGKTITTTEPKFIPSEAASLSLADALEVKVRLIDCVGYMVDGAAGHLEDEKERMVKTPWFAAEIPFTEAAKIGTDKVMKEHSTIGIVITTDGSVTDIPRESYRAAEEQTILTLKASGKPFLVLVNTKRPYSEEAKQVALELESKYQISTAVVNCEQLKREDIHKLLEMVLYEFPISDIEFYMPKWVDMLPRENQIKQDMVKKVKELLPRYKVLKDVCENPILLQGEYIENCRSDKISLGDGTVKIHMEFDEKYYYQMLSDMMGQPVEDEYQLVNFLREYASMKMEYQKYMQAIQAVREKGYGVVTPQKDEILLEDPIIIKHGNKYGVKIKATCPSIHMIRANIQTEIAPIVGTKEQAEDLISYVKEAEGEDGIWETNIFGKTVEQLVDDGMVSKVVGIGEESQQKLQDSMQKIVNSDSGGMVCIII